MTHALRAAGTRFWKRRSGQEKALLEGSALTEALEYLAEQGSEVPLGPLGVKRKPRTPGQLPKEWQDWVEQYVEEQSSKKS